MKNPFDYHKPTEEQAAQIDAIRTLYKATHSYLLSLPRTREQSIAITNLEQSCMWATKGIVMWEEVAEAPKTGPNIFAKPTNPEPRPFA